MLLHSTAAMSLFYVMAGIALTCGALAIRRYFPRRLLIRLARLLGRGVRSLLTGVAASAARPTRCAAARSAVRITVTGGDPAAKRRRGDQLRAALAELAHERGAAPVPNTAIRIDMALARNGIPYLAYLERDEEAGLSLVRIASILDDVPIHVDQQHTNLANIYREITRFDRGVTFVGLPAAGGEPVREGPTIAGAAGGPAVSGLGAATSAPRMNVYRPRRDCPEAEPIFEGGEIPLDGFPVGPCDIDIPLSLDGAGRP